MRLALKNPLSSIKLPTLGMVTLLALGKYPKPTFLYQPLKPTDTTEQIEVGSGWYSKENNPYYTKVSPLNNYPEIKKLINQVLSSSAFISNPREFVKSFEDLFLAREFKPEGITVKDYAKELLQQIIDPHHQVTQGKRATCGATNIQLSLAKFDPIVFAKLAVGFATSEQRTFLLEFKSYESIDFLIPEDCFLTDDSRRPAVSRILQSCFMEYLNGDKRHYSNQTGSSYDEHGPLGRGVGMTATRELLCKLFSKRFVILEHGFDLFLIEQIAAFAGKEPIFVSLDWRKPTAQELEDKVKKYGGDASRYVSKDGYFGHMLSVVGIGDNQVFLSTTWSAKTHKKFVYMPTIGRRPSTPKGFYDPSSGLIVLSYDEFSARAKKLILVEPVSVAANDKS